MYIANSIQAVLTMLTLISLGILAAKLGFVGEETEVKLSKLTLNFSVPCLLFVSCLKYISRELVSELGFILLIPVLIILIGYLLAIGVGKLFRIPRENFGLFCVMFSMSNAIFIGLPICLMIFGEEALPLVAAYFPFNALLFWTIGAVGIAADAGKKEKLGLNAVKKILTPPLLGAFFGAVFALIGISLPVFLTDAMSYMGSLTTPVACILVGCTVKKMGKDMFKISKEGNLTLIGRFIVSPAIALGLCLFFQAPALVTNVFTLEAAMPVMSQSMLLSRSYGANHRLAAQMIAVTAVITMFYVPGLIFLLSRVVV
ncbi:MAG: AEC family transporter [Lachnospiraceae bacterium]|nr:AEC family transporter [Lachnospiraceae bacterium]